MNGNQKTVSERLYLEKDENDEIYVDSLCHQHHIDGIRFLYKQFKKKNPGVIINNPLGYGNSMLVALFLGAIQHLLDKPILILCEESEELNWLEHFQKLTNCYSVGIAAESPFVKKSIFINTMERLEQFCRRDWSVMVVDNDEFLNKNKFKTKFKADYKIWVTPVDMKENLQKFASIFEWLYPKEKLNIEDYKPKPRNVKDTVTKAMLLDSFLQDIVCRTHLLTPFETPYTKSEGTPKKASKKYKDVTGTKIKRSKRSSDCAGTSNRTQANDDAEAGASEAKIPKRDTPERDTGDFSIADLKNDEESAEKSDVTNNKDSEMDVESFILNKKPIKYDPLKDFMQDYDDVSRSSEESRTDLVEAEPTIFDSPEKFNRLLTDATMDVVVNEGDFVDSDTNSDSLMPRPKSVEESSQESNGSEYNLDRDQLTPEFLTDNIINEIKEETTEPFNAESNNYLNPGFLLKVEEPNNVVESPKKDLNSKITEMDEQIYKKFQGSLLDRLF